MSRKWVLLAVAVLVGLSTAVRVTAAYRTAGLDLEDPRGMLRSDPALLFYLTSRVVESEGALPEDWRADPRIESGSLTDVPAQFAVGQEFLVGWSYRALGLDVPLHLYCVWVLGLMAALGAVGVYLLCAALTGRREWGLVGALLWTLLPANYRTMGFVLMREDLSVPLFLIHVGVGAHALRSGSRLAYAASALWLVAALATWHAASLLFSFEAALAFGWFLVRGRALASGAGPRLALAILVAGALAVPLLRTKGLLASPAMALVFGLALGACFPRRARLVGVAGALALGAVAARVWPTDYGHVVDLLWAKLVTLGQKPVDPAALSFDTRLLWQGPFETLALDFSRPAAWVAVVFAIAVAARTALRLTRGERGPEAVLGTALVGAIALAYLVDRLGFLVGALAPAWLVLELARAPSARAARLAAAGLTLQAGLFSLFWVRNEIDWYEPEAFRNELRGLVEWVERETPADAVLAADFVIGPALLAHTGRAIALQPKYEAGRSRQRARAFVEHLYGGDLDALGGWLREECGARYLVLDRSQLAHGLRYVAGLSPLREGFPKNAPVRYLAGDGAAPELRAAGFVLRHRSATSWDYFRVYECTDLP